MRALHCIYMISISGICLGLVPGYPLHDTNVLSDLRNGAVNVDELNQHSRSLHSKPSSSIAQTTSRLSKLLHTYKDLMRLSTQPEKYDMLDDRRSLLDLIGSGNKDTGNENYSRLVPFLDHSSVSGNGQDSTLDIAEPKSKRQQGWYIQYGKRSQGSSVPESPLDQTAMLFDDLDKEDGQSPTFSPRLENQVNPYIVNLLKNIRLLSENPRESAVSDQRRYEENNLAGQADVFRTSKRQQGWYTQYGKRSVDPGLHMSLLL